MSLCSMSAPLFRRALMSSIKNHIAESFFMTLSLVSLSGHSGSQNLAEGMFQVIYHFFHKKRNLDYYKSNNFIFYNVVTCGIRFHISGCSYQEVTAHGTSSKTMLVPKTSQIGNLVQVQNMSVEALSRTSPATYLARILALVKPRVCESPSSSVVIKLKQVVIQFTNVKIKTSWHVWILILIHTLYLHLSSLDSD